jgi:hypothetical protein
LFHIGGCAPDVAPEQVPFISIGCSHGDRCLSDPL